MKSLLNKYCIGLNKLRHKEPQKARTVVTKESKEFGTVKRTDQQSMAQATQKETQRYHRTADALVL